MHDFKYNTPHSYPDSNSNPLSRTSSSNFYDNQSDYEVILDDGTRQKRTISLSTLQSIPSQQLDSSSYSRKLNSERTLNEDTPLLAGQDTRDKKHLLLSESSTDSEHEGNARYDLTLSLKRYQYKSFYRKWTSRFNEFRKKSLVLTHNQKMILKCSFAYSIGSLFTFVPKLNALCGSHVASHMASTVTVFFHPAKSVGGIIEAAGFGWLYTLAALTLNCVSMYTTNYFIENSMPITAAVVTLGVWLAGSTFLISYLKAKINTPSILTASGLAFIIIFTVTIRQGSFIENEFDISIIGETFGIVAIGTIISLAVCIFIWPMTASKKLRDNIDSSLSSTRILLKLLTKTFLLDVDLPEFTNNTVLENALKDHRTSFTKLKIELKAAKLEFYNLDMKKHSEGYDKIVESLQRLAQHVGGLRSSCGLQVQVMQSAGSYAHQYNNRGVEPIPEATRRPSNHRNETYNLKYDIQRKKMEYEIKRERIIEDLNNRSGVESSPASSCSIDSKQKNSADTDASTSNTKEKKHIEREKKEKEGPLVQFIRTVRYPMKSLAYTCKQTIIHLQVRFRNETTDTTPSFQLLQQNLSNAIELFEKSQHQALTRFYRRKFKKNYSLDSLNPDKIHPTLMKEFSGDDIFLVYFFVFCLLEFVKELMTLVECARSVYEKMDEEDRSGSIMAWLRYLFTHMHGHQKEDIFTPNNHNTFNTLHTPTPKTNWRKFFLNLWGFFSAFKTHRVRFALKSMITAEIFSVFAFIPSTRSYFVDFRMEWTLITVMAVMTPTVGGTNMGALLRILATVFGCIIAAIVYTLFEDCTFILWFITWLISIPSFWLILQHKHGRFGLFTLLAYNLVVLFKYNNRYDDSINVFEIAWMRCVAVSLGVVLGLIVTAYIWPYEARTQVRKGISDLLLRLLWLYKQLVSVYSEDEGTDPLDSVSQDINISGAQMLLNETSILAKKRNIRETYLQKTELSIQLTIFELQGLLVHAPNEPRLKGAFPTKTYSAMLNSCQNILDKFLAMRVVILKDVWAMHVRRSLLLPVSDEFMEMTGNVFLYFYLLASALQLKTPLPPFFPQAEKTRKALMKRLQQLPTVIERNLRNYNLTEEKKDECYMVYYAYVVLMESIIQELDELGKNMKELFGSLVPDDQWAKCFGQLHDIENNRMP
ncbi:hypothetical protein K501DRAFT_242578 [Backusella circina FSU 941]|nr:hypothetical protein K501DRAFT_242578 [Backusella circina FSU 941]